MAYIICVCTNNTCGKPFSVDISCTDPKGTILNVPSETSTTLDIKGPECPTCGISGKMLPGQFNIPFGHDTSAIPATLIGEPIQDMGFLFFPPEQPILNPQVVHKNLVCTKCGTEYPGMSIHFNEHTRSHMSGASISGPCPKCGHNNELDLGAITIDERGLTQIFSGPEFTPDTLSKVKELVERTVAEPAKIAEFTEAANAIVPSLGDKLETYISSRKNVMEFMKFLLTIITAVLAGLTFFKNKQTPAPVINNYYTIPAPSQVTPAQQSSLRRIQSGPALKGSNYTPPKKKRKSRRK